MVRSSMISMSGRRPSTFWAYQRAWTCSTSSRSGIRFDARRDGRQPHRRAAVSWLESASFARGAIGRWETAASPPEPSGRERAARSPTIAARPLDARPGRVRQRRPGASRRPRPAGRPRRRRAWSTITAARIAEPGPGQQRRPEVVAADVRVHVRGVEEQRDDQRRAGQEGVAPVSHGASREESAGGMASARSPSWAAARVTRSPSLRGRSPRGSPSEPRNCSARAMYQNPSHVAGLA